MHIMAFVAPVPDAKKDDYIEHATIAGKIMKEYGATRYVETWADNVPAGEVTSFPLAVKLEEGERVVVGWAEWPDKDTAETGMQRFMQDPRMKDFMPPFDGKRLIWGSFDGIVEL